MIKRNLQRRIDVAERRKEEHRNRSNSNRFNSARMNRSPRMNPNTYPVGIVLHICFLITHCHNYALILMYFLLESRSIKAYEK